MWSRISSGNLRRQVGEEEGKMEDGEEGKMEEEVRKGRRKRTGSDVSTRRISFVKCGMGPERAQMDCRGLS